MIEGRTAAAGSMVLHRRSSGGMTRAPSRALSPRAGEDWSGGTVRLRLLRPLVAGLLQQHLHSRHAHAVRIAFAERRQRFARTLGVAGPLGGTRRAARA